MTPSPSYRPTRVTLAPTLKPTLNLTAQLQSSALELVPNEKIVSDSSSHNVVIYNDTAIVGAPSNDNRRGSVFVHVKDDKGEWSQQAKLVAPDGVAGDKFGWSVALFGDTIIVGAMEDDDNGNASGSAHVFVRNGVMWSHQTKLLAPDGAAYDRFGRSVAIYGDTAIVCARLDDDNGENSGSAHVFVRNGVTWSPQAKLLAPDGAAKDLFGWPLAIYCNTVIIGAIWDDDNGNASGSAHIFVRNGVTWSHQAKLLAPDGAAGDNFGTSVAVYGDNVIVGARFDDENGYRSGSAHIFVRNGVTWSHQAKLLAPDGAADDQFGNSVSVHGNSVIVGAPFDDDNEENRGSAHVFVQNGATWTPHAKILAPKSGEQFGGSVSIYNGTIAVASHSGEAYVFSG